VQPASQWPIRQPARILPRRVPEECPKELPPMIEACMQLHAANRPSATMLAAQLAPLAEALQGAAVPSKKGRPAA